MFRYARILMAVSCLAWMVGCDNQKTTPPAVSVAVSPTTANVDTGLTQQITATVTNASNTSVNWSVSGVAGGNATVGTIDATGLYTAPAVPPVPATVTVAATSVADSTKSASTTVTITNIQVAVSPATVNVGLGLTQQFTATVTGSTTTTVTWSVNGIAGGNATVGTINAAGLYTAPAVAPSPDTVTIAAASTVNISKTGSGGATIAAGPVIAGTVAKGPLNGATVTAYAVNADGSNGSALGSTTTDSSGNFNVALSSTPAGAVRVVAHGGSYKSEASGNTVTGTSDTASLLDSVASNVSGVAVTPLTHFVNSLTVHKIKTAGAALRKGRAVPADTASAAAHASANSAVAAFFGLSGEAPIEALHPKFGKDDIAGDPDGFKVGLAIGTLALEGEAIAPGSPDDLIDALGRDLGDGHFDGHDDTGVIVTVGDTATPLPPTAGTTDFLTTLNACVESCDSVTGSGILPSDVVGPVGDISGGVASSDITPSAVGLSAGSSGAVGSISFGGRQYVFMAARSGGVAVIDVTNPAAPTAKLWTSVYTTVFSSSDVGGVIPVVGTATHPQVLAFAYGTKHVALLNAQILAAGTPGVDDGSLVDFQADLPWVGGIVGFSGGSAYVAGGIPDSGRKGVWLASTDGYAFFDLTTNSLTTVYSCSSTSCDGNDPLSMLAENLGGDIGHNLLLAGNYNGVQLVDLFAAKSYYMDSTYYTTNVQPLGYIIDGDAVDGGLHVGIFTFEDTNTAGFLNLATLTKTDGISGAPNTFVPATTDGFVGVTFGSSPYPVFSGSAVDSGSHLALFMAGYSTSMGVGQLQDPAAAAPGTWTGLSDWSYYDLNNSGALSYSYAADPHAAGVVFNIGAGKPYGYLLDGCACRAIQIDMAGFLALPRAGATGDAAHTPVGDPVTAGTVMPIPFGP